MNSNNILPPSMAQSKAVDAPVQDFWNLDFDDLFNDDDIMDDPAPTPAPAPPARGRSPPKPTATRATTTTTANTAVNRRPTPIQRSKSDDAYPAVSLAGRSPPRPARIQRSKSSEETSPVACPRQRPRETRSRTSKSKSPKRSGGSKSPLRLPTFGRTRSNSRPRTPNANTNTNATVCFDKVQVREFQQILGDNPCEDNGPSLGLGWKYHEKKDTDLEKYESKRNGNDYYSIMTMGLATSTRKGEASSLSPKARTNIALELGYSWLDIERNKRQNEKIQSQRKKTLNEGTMPARTNEDGLCYDPVAILKRARASHGFAQS